MKSKSSCQGKNHKMHMCALKESGFDKKNPKDFKKLTDNPQYECGNCGSLAHDKANVCKPVKL